mmetsp:Transcript_7917/g.25977  ORF Transcript_7917/g.25977 Transcript_7917/m.25977 type:complete len:501 (+) Transcript_7917:6522-8024(+)
MRRALLHRLPSRAHAHEWRAAIVAVGDHPEEQRLGGVQLKRPACHRAHAAAAVPAHPRVAFGVALVAQHAPHHRQPVQWHVEGTRIRSLDLHVVARVVDASGRFQIESIPRDSDAETGRRRRQKPRARQRRLDATYEIDRLRVDLSIPVFVEGQAGATRAGQPIPARLARARARRIAPAAAAAVGVGAARQIGRLVARAEAAAPPNLVRGEQQAGQPFVQWHHVPHDAAALPRQPHEGPQRPGRRAEHPYKVVRRLQIVVDVQPEEARRRRARPPARAPLRAHVDIEAAVGKVGVLVRRHQCALHRAEAARQVRMSRHAQARRGVGAVGPRVAGCARAQPVRPALAAVAVVRSTAARGVGHEAELEIGRAEDGDHALGAQRRPRATPAQPGQQRRVRVGAGAHEEQLARPNLDVLLNLHLDQAAFRLAPDPPLAKGGGDRVGAAQQPARRPRYPPDRPVVCGRLDVGWQSAHRTRRTMRRVRRQRGRGRRRELRRRQLAA